MIIFFQKYKTIIISCLVIGIALFLFISQSKGDFTEAGGEIPLLEPSMEDPIVQQEKQEIEEVPKTIFVDIKGAVKLPGLYEATEGERVFDVLEQAGGVLDIADEKQINFAQKVSDEMVIYIPVEGEEVASHMSQPVIGSQESGKVNINRADQAELETLPGIGPSKANAIIEYREQNGNFTQIGDMKKVSGIGEKTFERLEELIAVN